MRRLSLVCLAAVVSAGLVLGPSSGLSTSAATSATSGKCVWKKHTKRVVKHVRRHGKRRRIVRVRHWWRCVPRPAPTPAPPTLPPTPIPPPPPPPDPDPVGPSRLGVESREFSYTLSRPTVKAGDFIVELNNSGDDPHDLNIAASDGQGGRTGDDLASIATVDPGGQADTRFTIAPGSYYIYCSLPRHEGFGMHVKLTVTP